MKTKIYYFFILLSFLYIGNAFGQERTVTGIVTEAETGENLPGVNVQIKGTTNGVQTDVDGNYSLTVSPGDTLVFSFIGLQSQDIAVGDLSTINVSLIEDANLLDEVVLIGYGTQKKSDLTGSLSSVSSKDFDKQPLTRVDQALQGRAAGVQVNQTSGAPGSGYKIRIRGANSISGSNDPLYVVDGLVVGNISSINVNDIKSMEVLKDASATAIYGSRGANGVVLLTTKSGRSGPAKVEFEIFGGVSRVAQKLKLMTPGQFAEGVNFAEGSEFYTSQEIAALNSGGGEDWQSRLFKKAPFISTQLSVSGGSDNINYFISGNYYDADGTIINQNYKRYNLRANINADLSKKVKLGLNSFITKEKFTGARADLATGLTWDPTTPAFDELGNYNSVPLKPGVGNGYINPLIIPQNNVQDNYNDRLTVSGYFNFDLSKSWVLNISGGMDNFNTNNNSYIPILVNKIGQANVFDQQVNRLQNTNRITYSNDNNPNHVIKLDLVHEQQVVTRKSQQAFASKFFSDQTTYKNLFLGAVQRIQNEFRNEKLQSVLGRINYSIFEKYLLTASLRADGSSKFRKGKRWGYFPSAAFAWKVSDENFLKDVQDVSFLKFRLSYGVTGSQAIEPLATRSVSIIDPSVNYPFTGGAFTVGVAPSNQLANPDLTWETTRQFNGGFDVGFWNSALTFSLDLYHKKTSDLLLETILPSFVGPTRVTRNIGEVENKGLDVTLGLRILENEDWHINSTLTLNRNRNKVLALVDGKPLELGADYYQNTFPVKPTRVEVGKPINSFRGYIFEGVYQENESAEAAKVGKAPGDAKYKDISGPNGVPDGAITTDDITTIGNGNPKFTWGWNWDISFRSWDLNFVILGSQGNDIYNFQRARMMGLGAQQFHAVHADYNNRWTTTNPSNIPSGRDGTEILSTQFLEKGSYMTFKNVALSYNFNFKFMERMGIDKIRLYTNAENLFIFTKYRGFDPESTASGNSDVDLGIDYNAYPINRSFSFGLNLGF